MMFYFSQKEWKFKTGTKLYVTCIIKKSMLYSKEHEKQALNWRLVPKKCIEEKKNQSRSMAEAIY